MHREGCCQQQEAAVLSRIWRERRACTQNDRSLQLLHAIP